MKIKMTNFQFKKDKMQKSKIKYQIYFLQNFKKIILFSFFTFGVFNFANALTINSQTGNAGGDTLKSGLVGHWTFDGADLVSNVADKSGNGNHGNMVGFTSTSSAKVGGVLGQALKFDKVSNQYVNITDNSTLDNTTTLSFGGWFYLGRLVSWNPIICKRINATNNNSYCSFVDSSGLMYIDIDSSNDRLTSTTILSPKRWYHFMVVYDGNIVSDQRTKLYINGMLDKTSSETSSSIPDYSAALNLGNGVSGSIEGRIDDVRIYNRALSVSEIQKLYSQGGSKLTSQTPNAGGDTLKSGLVGWWTFDGADLVSNVADKSGNGNTGNMVNMATSSAKVGGVLGQALKFDGVDDYVNIGDPTSVDFGSGNFALATWFVTRNPTGSRQILIGKDVAGNRQFGLVYDANDDSNNKLQIFYYLNSTSAVTCNSTSNNLVADTKWHHLAGQRYGNTFQMYLDGVRINCDEAGTHGSMAASSAILRIGAREYVGFNNNLSGSLDDVRIYNRALSASEIQKLYNQGGSKLNSQTGNAGGDTLKQGLAAWWTFDGADLVSNVADKSGSGNTGYMVNMATSTAKVVGKLGQALNFDGSDDYVDINDVDASLVSNSSISVWIKPSTVSVSHRIFAGRTNSAPVVGIYPGGWGFIASGSTQGNQRTGSVSTVKLNAWNHLVVTYNASSVPSIYVNGTEVTYGAATYWGSTNSSIGKGGGGTFQGSIDDLRLYNRILTAQEIKKLYNMGK